MITLDIMMPFYGEPALFRSAVESVLEQTDPHWRLVIIDDQYPDTEPGQWVQSLNDDRIVYQRNEVNLGVSGNFGRCIALAKADFTTIIGCDDLLLPNYVERIRSLINQFPQVDYIQPGVEVIDSVGAPALPLADRVKNYYRPNLDQPRVLEGEALAISLLRGNWTYFPSIAWRTTTLHTHGFRTEFDVVLDLALQLDIVVTGGRLALDNVPAFRYRRHSESVSAWTANDGSRFIEESRFFGYCAERMHQLGWNKAMKVASWHVSSRLNALTRLPASLRGGDMTGTRTLLKHALGRVAVG
jgi:glycosyltransferase involved in cell wall biosynthesis